MTKSEFQKVKKLIAVVERLSLAKGEDITSPDFEEALRIILSEKGFSLEEFRAMEEETPFDSIEKIKGKDGKDGEQGPKGEDGKDGKNGSDGSKGEIGPKGPPGKDGKDGRTPVAGKDFPIPRDGKDGKDGQDGKDADATDLKKTQKSIKKLTTGFEKFQYNIDIISQAQKSMPDFRKLGMGLQAQIDENKAAITKESLWDRTGTTLVPQNTGDGLAQIEHIDFNLTPSATGQEGRLMWNADDGTLSVGMPGGDVNLQVGQEQLIRGKMIGADGDNGTIVYISGASGLKPEFTKAKADAVATAECTIGITTEDISQNANGYVNTFGLVRDVNTDPGTYTAGETLYLSAATAGGYTNVEPTDPNYSITIGYVVAAHATEGIIFFNVNENIWKTVLTQEYVPYTGANANVDLGAYNITTTGTGSFGSATIVTLGGAVYSVEAAADIKTITNMQAAGFYATTLVQTPDILADDYYDQAGGTQWGGTDGAGNLTLQGGLYMPSDGIYDSSSNLSIDPGNRILYATGGIDPILDWSTAGTAEFGDSNITTTGKLGVGISPVSKAHIYQDDATGGTGTGLTIEQDGTGDAIIQYLLSGVRRWVVGVDNDANDKYVWSATQDLSASPLMSLDTSGNLVLDGGGNFSTTGNVGIGTAAVSTIPLKVAGYNAGDPTVGLIRVDTDTGTNDRGFKIGAVVNGNVFMQGAITGVSNNADIEFQPLAANVIIPRDDAKLAFGVDGITDSYLQWGGANLELFSAGDFDVACGTDKTLELQETVWKDINIGSANLTRPIAGQPDVDEFVDEAGDDTGIETFAFAIGEKIQGGFEMQHDYAEGTDFTFHVHWQGITAPSGTDNVQWRLKYIVLRTGQTLDAPVTIDSPDCPIDTQYEVHVCSFAAITGTNYNIGDQFYFELERVASTGDAYLGDALTATIGIHYQVNTIGSRTITAK